MALSVYLNGEIMGTWAIDQRGLHSFQYAERYIVEGRGVPLSLSLPLLPGNEPHNGPQVASFFENLLPDSAEILRRLQVRFATRSTSAYHLLAEIGRDCVGAIQVVPDDERPPTVRTIDAEPVTPQRVAQLLRATASPPGFAHGRSDEFRISIAGAQEKTALLRRDGAWMIPHGATPSTHILKMPLGVVTDFAVDLSLSPENEWISGRLMSALGFPVAEATLDRFEDQRVLVVKRFDRRETVDGTWIERIPVEDFCQATATPPERKYERDGGPGIPAISRILQAAGDTAGRLRFLTAQFAMWLLGAPDAHAKNFSLYLLDNGTAQLTPLYDVLSAWPVVGDGPGRIPIRRLRMAMAVARTNRHYLWHEIHAGHWMATAQRVGIDATHMRASINDLIDRVPGAIDAVGDQVGPEIPEGLAEAIFRGVRSSAAQARGELREG